MSGRVIAIDGPAASGKSSVSRGVAAALGYIFVSSGHFYRALAWGIIHYKVPIENDAAVEEFVQGGIWNYEMQANQIPIGIRILVHDQDITPYLSDPEVAAMVSKIAALPTIRNAINASLRSLAATSDLVMEGRDIGSVVFPETPYKFYLDATPEERARRRAQQGAVDSVAERDHLDSTRTTAPLMIPEGAMVIDTTHLSLEQVEEAVLVHLKTSPFPLSGKPSS